MCSKKKVGVKIGELRQLVEEIEGKNIKKNDENMDALSPEGARRLLNELRVHQMEMEMQNEELRRTKDELAASRELLLNFFNLTPVGYLTISEKGLIVEANLTMEKLLGISRNQLIGQPFTRFIYSEDQDRYYLNNKQLFITGTSKACELRLMNKSSGQFWIQMEATVMFGGDDTAHCHVVISDITERKQTEETLQESETKYRQLFEMEADALFLIDSQSGNLLEVNLAAVTQYGYSRDELLRMRHVDLSAEPEETEKATINAGSKGTVVVPLRYHRKKDGTIFPVEINSTSLIWKGRPSILPSIRDISERKNIEADLRSICRKYRCISTE